MNAPKDFTPWEPIESEIFYQSPWRTYRKETFYTPSGRKQEYAYRDHQGGAIILPQLENGKFLLLRNFRYLLKDISIEIPRGAIENNENFEETARHELEQETGYKAGEIVKIGNSHTNNSTTNEYAAYYLAKDLKEGTQKLDITEKDEIKGFIELSSEEITKMILNGEITDSFTIIAMKFYDEYLKANS